MAFTVVTMRLERVGYTLELSKMRERVRSAKMIRTIVQEIVRRSLIELYHMAGPYTTIERGPGLNG
jgi:hypothetical protein